MLERISPGPGGQPAHHRGRGFIAAGFDPKHGESVQSPVLPLRRCPSNPDKARSQKMRVLLVTRPLEDGEETARQLALRGHQALLAPLLTTRFLDGAGVDAGWRAGDPGDQRQWRAGAGAAHARAAMCRCSRWDRRPPPKRKQLGFAKCQKRRWRCRGAGAGGAGLGRAGQWRAAACGGRRQ